MSNLSVELDPQLRSANSVRLTELCNKPGAQSCTRTIQAGRRSHLSLQRAIRTFCLGQENEILKRMDLIPSLYNLISILINLVDLRPLKRHHFGTILHGSCLSMCWCKWRIKSNLNSGTISKTDIDYERWNASSHLWNVRSLHIWEIRKWTKLNKILTDIFL